MVVTLVKEESVQDNQDAIDGNVGVVLQIENLSGKLLGDPQFYNDCGWPVGAA